MAFDSVFRDVNISSIIAKKLGDDASAVRQVFECAAKGIFGRNGIDVCREYTRNMRRPGECTAVSFTERPSLPFLKQACREAGVRVSGKREDLLERLRPHHVPPAVQTRIRAVLREDAILRAIESPPPPDDLPRITATRAKSEYQITDDQLDLLPVRLARNPYGGSSAPMRLYQVAAVKALAEAVHGTLSKIADTIEAKANAKRARAEKLSAELAEECVRRRAATAEVMRSIPSGDAVGTHPDTLAYINGKTPLGPDALARAVDGCVAFNLAASIEREERESRASILHAAMRARGLEVRADSRMCAQFLDGTLTDLDRVIDTMAEMRFLFKHTRYASIRQDVYRAYRHDDADEYFDGGYAHVDKDAVSAEARAAAIHQFFRGPPSKISDALDDMPDVLRARAEVTLAVHSRTAGECGPALIAALRSDIPDAIKLLLPAATQCVFRDRITEPVRCGFRGCSHALNKRKRCGTTFGGVRSHWKALHGAAEPVVFLDAHTGVPRSENEKLGSLDGIAEFSAGHPGTPSDAWTDWTRRNLGGS
jgi:hypothetical protein